MGYFAVDRQLFDHWLWEQKPFSEGQAWIDLIGLANFEDSKTPYKGKIITCKRGTVYRSISYLANRWGWSRDRARRFLKLLEDDEMIRLNATTNNTTITLVNYDFFQGSTTTDKATNRQRVSQRADSEQYKERRRIKKNKEGEEVCVSAPTPTPSLDEVKAYCRERGFTHVNAEKFWNLYESRNWLENGQPFKWKQRLAYWEAKDIASGERKSGKKKAALDEDFWNELREKARKEDEERAKRERDAAG